MSDAVVRARHGNYWDAYNGVSNCGREDIFSVLGPPGACGVAAVDLWKALGTRVDPYAAIRDAITNAVE